MKAATTIVAYTVQEAQEKADEHFRSFYGEQPFQIVHESAESTAERGEVLAWVFEFEAEAVE